MLWSRLTERDRRILALVDEHRVLTTDQLCALAFDSMRRAQHRLVELYRLGVLWRFRRPVVGGGSQPWHYTVGYEGARLLAAQRAKDPPSRQAHIRRLERIAESPRLQHQLGVNSFFAAVAGYARAMGLRPAYEPDGEGLICWLSEQRVSEDYRYLGSKEYMIRPDGYGVWRQRGEALGFYLEYDRGTEPCPLGDFDG